ncbi:hypothetical protein CR513_18302, partial [Mucuna pruriens]
MNPLLEYFKKDIILEDLEATKWLKRETSKYILETPFRLTFDIEAVIPVEIDEPSPWTTLFHQAQNKDEIRTNLDLLQEVRKVAHIKEYAVKARVAR